MSAWSCGAALVLVARLAIGILLSGLCCRANWCAYVCERECDCAFADHIVYVVLVIMEALLLGTGKPFSCDTVQCTESTCAV